MAAVCGCEIEKETGVRVITRISVTGGAGPEARWPDRWIVSEQLTNA